MPFRRDGPCFSLKYYRLPSKNDATVSGVSMHIGLDTTNDAASFSSVNDKTSKKSMADRAVSPQWAMLFFEVLTFPDKKTTRQCKVCWDL